MNEVVAAVRENGHFVTAWMIETFGGDRQRDRWLPRMATGEIRPPLR